jgi:DNA-binding transcriptional LysR family regulator
VVEEASTGLRGNLRIGTMTRLGMVDLAPLLGAFHRKYPLVDVQVTTSPTGSSGLADDVRHGRLDVALLGLPPAELSGLDARELAAVPFGVLVPSSHRLAGRASVTLKELAGERFVDMLRGFGNRRMVDQAFERAGIPRQVQVEVPDLSEVPEYVRAGLGIAVVPDVAPTVTEVVHLRLTEPELAWTLSVATIAGRAPSRAVVALQELLTDAVRSDYF